MLDQSLILLKDNRSGHGKTAAIGSHLFVGLTKVTVETIDEPAPVAPRGQKMLGQKPEFNPVVVPQSTPGNDLGVPATPQHSSGR